MENIVNIYVSAESLKVFEKPWVEGTTPTPPGPAEDQHPVTPISENSRRRNRSDSVFRVAVCLLLLAGLVAFIYLGVKMNRDNSERKLLKKQLDELKRQRYFLWWNLCSPHLLNKPNGDCIWKGKLKVDDGDPCKMLKCVGRTN